MSCLSLQDLSEHDLEVLLREEARREVDPAHRDDDPSDMAPFHDTPTYADLVGQLEWALRRIRTSLDTGTMYIDALDTLNRARQALRSQP